MRQRIRYTTFAGAALALTLSAAAQEKKIERGSLPAAVARTVDQQTKGATVQGFTTEREHGKKVYEAETVVDGHTRDIQIAEDGTVNEVEEEVSFNSLSDGVKRGLTAKAAGARITKVESLTKGGRLVAYEAATLQGNRKGEVQVGPDGAMLKHAE